MKAAARRLVLEVLGWGLVLLGIAALVLPGPGLLMLVGGMIILSQQYEWAERRLEPLKAKALRGAAEGVETWPRIVMSTSLGLVLIACGILWIVKPDAPDWWPLSDGWWLPGGLWTGVTQILSGLIALGLLIYSYRNFRPNPFEAPAAEAEPEVGQS